MNRRDVIVGGLTMAAATASGGSGAVSAAGTALGAQAGGATAAAGAGVVGAAGAGAAGTGARSGGPSAGGSGGLITRRIPSSGEEIPVLGLGTSGPFEVGRSDAARAPLKAVLEAFFAGGGKLIDTSPMYSTAEEVLGDLMTPAMRERAFIATKVWTRGEREGVQQMTKSGELMKRPKLDLIQVHNLLDLDTHLKTLRAWKAEGRVRYIGITHYTVGAQSDLAKVIEREKLDFVQLNYSATTRDAEKRLLPLAADKGVAVLVNRPFEDGGMFNAVRGKPLPAWAAEIDATSWGQIFLKYVLAHPAVTAAIPATGKVNHLEDNLAGARGRLPDAKLKAEIVRVLTS